MRVHNSGKVKSTKAFCTWEIIHTEMFETRIEARKEKNILNPQQEGVGVNLIWGISSVG